MTEITKAIRLKVAATEFNVGISTIVDFLNGKGYALENNPNSKLSDEMYQALLEKFQPDKLDKQKAVNLKLTPNIHKEDKPVEIKPPVKYSSPVPAPIIEEKPTIEPVTEEKETKKQPEPKEETTKEKKEEKPKLKVVGKVDLESLEIKKTRGKKAKDEIVEETKEILELTETITEDTAEEKTEKVSKSKSKQKPEETPAEPGWYEKSKNLLAAVDPIVPLIGSMIDSAMGTPGLISGMSGLLLPGRVAKSILG